LSVLVYIYRIKFLEIINTPMINSRAVEKETITAFHFQYVNDVLSNSEDRVLRYLSLQKGLILGNAYHGKVTLTLVTADIQYIAVTTTIWSISDSHVTLKGGVNVPINSIYTIEF